MTCKAWRERAVSVLLTLVMILSLCVQARTASAESVQVRAAALSSETPVMNGMVRVWLSSLGSPTSLHLTVNGRYSISSSGEFLSSGSGVDVSFNSSTGAISIAYNGQKKSVGKSFSLRRHSADGSNGILISESRESQNPYPGDLSFEAVSTDSGYRLYVIAHIYIENYLYGVLPYEMGNSTSIEALKAQAVAARTYTVRMMKSRASARYDVQDTTSDQVYRGTPSGNANCVAAIDQTKGIVLMYGSSYITTYYSASNGGQTETSRTGASYAYLPVKDDPFDYANTSSTVKKKTIYADLQSASNPSQLVSLLKSRAISKLSATGYAATSANTTLKTLKSITPHTPKYASPSRLYTKLDFTFTVSTQNASGQTVTVTQTVTCDIFGELESMLSLGIQSMDNELWSVETVSGGFQIQARRYGHGMGMSQRGAMQMAKLGYTYDEILGFYYENCSRVRHSFTSSILSSSSTDVEVTVEDPAELEGESASGKGRVSLSGVSATLPIRASRSETGRILIAAPNGAIVNVLSQDGDWCLICYGEICGYAPASALSITGEPSGDVQMVTDVAGFVTVTANDYVNLRASGSMSAKVLGTAPAGAVLTVLSSGGSWLKVQYHALSAYVNAGYVSALTVDDPSGETFEETDEPIDEPESNAPEEESKADDEAGDTAELTAIVVTEYGSLNMRADGYAGSRILTTIPKGERIEVEERGSVWSRVYYQGQSGYVMTFYLRFEGEETADSETPAQTETDATVTTPSGALNLRSQPRTSSEILCRIPQYATVRVHERGAEWCRVTYQGIGGYVMSTFLTFSETPEEKGEETPDEEENQPSSEGQTEKIAYVQTASGGLNLRAGAGSGYRVLAVIPRNAQITVTAYGSEWCAVRYGSMNGYAMTSFLRFEADQPSSGDHADSEDDAQEVQPDESSAVLAWVSTESGSLNLRVSPSSDAKILAELPQYAQVKLLEEGDPWSYVKYGEHCGYAMSRYLTVGSYQPEENEDQSEPEQAQGSPQTDDTLRAPAGLLYAQNAAGGDLSLWSMCWKAGAPLGRVPQGETVQVLLLGDTWCCVAYGDIQGYCLREELSVLEP